MHIFTFADTDFLLIPLTDTPYYVQPIFLHLWNKVGGAQNLCMKCICITNYVGGEPSTLLQLCHNLINRKGTQLVTKQFLTQCLSGIAYPFQKQSIIAWAADKYTQSVTTLQL